MNHKCIISYYVPERSFIYWPQGGRGGAGSKKILLHCVLSFVSCQSTPPPPPDMSMSLESPPPLYSLPPLGREMCGGQCGKKNLLHWLPPPPSPIQLGKGGPLEGVGHETYVYKTHNIHYKIQNTEHRTQNTEYRIQNTEYRN
jgi:hypothetical protein